MRSRVLLLIVLSLAIAGCAGPPKGDARLDAAVDAPYRLDSGDRLRVVVFEQETLSSTYAVDPSGHISMPLVGGIAARGLTTRELEGKITRALREDDYVRDPSVSVQIETFRPFFILGEVRDPGQYPYVSGLTAKTAVAVAGGFSPRADKSAVVLSRRIEDETVKARVPVDTSVMPGDTVQILERWF